MQQRIFVYDELTGEFFVNEQEIKLVNEFADLWVEAKKRCGCERNENGVLIGNPEAIGKYANYCKFVYLVSDAASPYRDFTDTEKINSAGFDAMLTGEEVGMEELKRACKKWSEIQEQDRNIRLLRSAQFKVDEMINYFSKPKEPGKTYGIKEINDSIKALDELGNASDMLDRFEDRIRVGESTQSSIRSDAVEGILIDFEKEKMIRMGKLNAEDKRIEMNKRKRVIEFKDVVESVDTPKKKRGKPRKKDTEDVTEDKEWQVIKDVIRM